MAVAAAALVAPACWPQAGFDARRSGFNGGETGITSATVAQLAPAWTATVGGGPGEPVVLGATAYVRTGGAVTALDTTTGAVRWTTPLAGAGLPVLAQNHVWVPVASSACSLASLDLGTGAVVDTRSFGGPGLPNNDQSFAACGTYDLVGVGKRLMIGWLYLASAFAPGQCLPNRTNAFGAAVNAFDTDTTAGAWNTGGITVTCDPLPTTPPAGVRGRLSSDSTTLFAPHAVVSSTGAADSVAGFSVATGAGQFSWATPSTVVTPVTPLSDASTELAAVATDGHLFVLDKDTGAVDWSADLGAAASTPAAVTDTTIFVAGGDGRVLAFPVGGCGAATCSPAWTATLPAAATARPSVVGDVLYVGGSDGRLTALPAGGCGAATCAALFATTVPGSVSGSPVADGGTLYVGSSTGTVTAYRIPT
ncbi:MAG TPA: PQQ-binding-like beta-propeller repeat protein [Acidimicrobiales bacterium]|nr:PQQ-binding-like beta-propeller repeat protein [Acidimicrobiales bacterium]